MSTWKRDFASGLIVLGPILATVFILYVLYGYLSAITPGLLIDAEFVDSFLPWINDGAQERIAGLLRVLTLLAIMAGLTLAIGYLMRTTAGDLAETALDNAANRVPGVRLVYNASKTATETALGGQDTLKTPVKLEVWDGLRMTAFKTGRTTADGRVTLFLPTSPNITTGFVLEVEEHEITELDETVEEALTRVLSAGFGDADRSETLLEDGIEIDVIDERVLSVAGEGSKSASEPADPSEESDSDGRDRS